MSRVVRKDLADMCRQRLAALASTVSTVDLRSLDRMSASDLWRLDDILIEVQRRVALAR